MPSTGGDGDLSSDDYVAQVLAREARDNSVKYSSQGLEAYMPKRPTSGAPRPNMRFLRNIIRDTDSHNASLKRKEDREARDRMRRLRDDSSTSIPSRDQKRHHRHAEDLGESRDRPDGRRERHRSHRRRHRSRSASTERDRSRRHRRRHDSYDSDGDRRRRHSRKDRRDDGHEGRRDRSYSRSRSRSPKSERRETRARRDDRHRLSPYRSLSPVRSRSRSPESSRSHRYREGSSRNGHYSSRQRHSSRRSTTRKESSLRAETGTDQVSGHESDPLEDLVGPLPRSEDDGGSEPIRSRGRGAYRPNLSNIDTHFAPDYDPTLDVSLEDDGARISAKHTRRPVPGLMTDDDDWELALEALRDRARWRQKGEERLREAGFNDSVVERWKNNAAFTGGEQTDGSVEDVKWSKKGEGREWDRGKYVDDEGSIDVRANW